MARELGAGSFVTENIRLVEELGRGAMGTVWVAEHLVLDTQVAVKLISARLIDLDHELEARERFALEAKAAARIKSPHVVQVFDAGVTDDGTAFIVMELLEGESLADRLERTGWLSVPQTVQVVRQVSKALTKAHAIGIVHRDIKPENIFLCPSDDGFFVKLLDFGIAKNQMAKSKLTDAGVMVGTPEYLSREQVTGGHEIDHRADLWALAVVAYEMLTGDVPFTGETLGMVCIAICDNDFRPPSTLRRELPECVDDWFERALHSEMDQRFQSALELANTFRAVMVIDDESDVLGEHSSDRMPVPGRGTSVGLGPDGLDAPRTRRGGLSQAELPLPDVDEITPRAAQGRRGVLAGLAALVLVCGGVGAYLLSAGGGSSAPAAASAVPSSTVVPTDRDEGDGAGGTPADGDKGSEAAADGDGPRDTSAPANEPREKTTKASPAGSPWRAGTGSPANGAKGSTKSEGRPDYGF